MAAPLTSHQDKQALTLDPGRRRSMRVLLSVPINVTGKTKENEDFSEDARTLVVNAHGALISLAVKVWARSCRMSGRAADSGAARSPGRGDSQTFGTTGPCGAIDLSY